MPPIVHLVRHAQGYHEVSKDGHLLHDPAITPHGRDECLLLRERFPYHDKIDLLLASPLRRTLETALLSFSPCITDHGLRILAIPSAQEATDEQSDTGSDIATLRTWFDDTVDLQFLTPGWNDKVGANSIDVASTKLRAKNLRKWIRERGESQVVLVTHGRFAHFLTGDVDEMGEQTTGWWVNDEFRTFTFVEEDEEGEASIKETEESVARREQIQKEKAKTEGR